MQEEIKSQIEIFANLFYLFDYDIFTPRENIFGISHSGVIYKISIKKLNNVKERELNISLEGNLLLGVFPIKEKDYVIKFSQIHKPKEENLKIIHLLNALREWCNPGIVYPSPAIRDLFLEIDKRTNTTTKYYLVHDLLPAINGCPSDNFFAPQKSGVSV
ncbi:hypothetical protein HY498_04805 [Candidatus Woesearchaeota archaeon]|nr:hypothetical protein [Candidatus Woesearchaeota archaeon]